MRLHNPVQGVGVIIGRRLALPASLLLFSPDRFRFIDGVAFRLTFSPVVGRFALLFRFRSAERFVFVLLALALAGLRLGLLSFVLA